MNFLPMASERHLIADDSKSYSVALLSSTEDIEDSTSTADFCQPSSHCHDNDRISVTGSREKQLAKRRLMLACSVSLVFMVGEVIGGYAAHSLAIMTDAAHLLTDFGSILVSLFSVWLSTRPRTKTMTFGWQRSEVLGALLSVLSIWVVTGVLVVLAVQRILSDDYEIHSQLMLITSGCAVGVNILMALILHQPSSHGHDHGHGLYHFHGSPGGGDAAHGHSHGGHGNTSVRAAFIHVVGDLLQSVGVLLAAVTIHFWPEFKVADPVCTFIFSFFVLGTSVTILKDVLRILMGGVPRGVDFSSVRETLLSLRGVKATHDLHMWSLSMTHSLLSVHLAVADDANPQLVLMEATKLLQSEFGFSSVTIQVEAFSEDMTYCKQCQELTD